MPAKPLTDVLRSLIGGQIAEIHTALPGRVEAYDFASQKATVKPLVSRKYEDGVVLSLPVISNVPVCWPSAGGASLTFPMRAGDTVLLVFAERALERWLSAGGETEPGDPRKHDLNDAIAIPGLRFFGAGEQADNADDVLLRYGSAKLRITDDGKVAFGSGADEVLDLLSLFMAQYVAARTVGENEALTTQAAVAALKVRLDAIKATL